MYYFDYASTTKPSKKNLDLYLKLLSDVYEHPDSGNKAGKLLEEAKQIILTSLQLNNDYEVVFTSGGTEANNLAIIGYAQNFTSNKHFITTKYEHSSVDSSFKQLEKLGHEVTYLDIQANGEIDYNQLENSIKSNTVMISIMAVNNELGSKNDENLIKSIIDKHNHKIIYMSDCVQAIGKVKTDYANIDMLTVSGHKLYAQKGIGAVIYQKPINLQNIIFGGQQQDGIRPGTICSASSVVLAIAIRTEMNVLENSISQTNRCMKLFSEFIENHPKADFNVKPTTNIVSVNFKTKALSESLISVLNNMDIYASTRSACSKKLNIPSRSLTSIGLPIEKIDRSIRFSFSHETRLEEVQYLINKLEHVLEIY